jgi:hypothetical protein
MKNSIVRNVLSAAILCITLAVAPQSVLAQRGGHGGGGSHGGGGFGGGGYHGGGGSAGGGSSYHGGGGYHGGGYGGYHGGGYGGWHGGYGGGHGGYSGWQGGYGGWGGGYWGYPGYGSAWGFGIGIGFGWGTYWGSGYPYVYGYGPAWAPPYSPYCYSDPYCYSNVPSGYIAGYAEPENSSSAYVGTSYSPSRASAPAPRNPTVTTSATVQYAAYRPPAASHGNGSASPIANSYRPGSPAGQQLSAARPEVQNVIRALRGMPPDARQRQIDSGRYGNLSPQELKFVKYAADLPPA